MTDIGALRRGGFLLESIGTLYAVYQKHKRGGPANDKLMLVRCFNLPFVLYIPIFCAFYFKNKHGLSLHVVVNRRLTVCGV